MGSLIRVKVSPCPHCGEDKWWMVDPHRPRLSYEERVRQARASIKADFPHTLLWWNRLGFLGLALAWRLRWEEKIFRRRRRAEVPADLASDELACVSCGYRRR